MDLQLRHKIKRKISLPKNFTTHRLLITMKLHLTHGEGKNLITAYTDNAITINHQTYSNNLIVSPDTLITDWVSASNLTLTLDNLTDTDFERIIALKPEVVLLGTGKTHQFLHPITSALLSKQGIYLECMTTVAACRTYNILMSEGRKVVAALLLN
jgi:uncharacterized protein